jgi:hypothetical protein
MSISGVSGLAGASFAQQTQAPAAQAGAQETNRPHHHRRESGGTAPPPSTTPPAAAAAKGSINTVA